MNIAAGIVNNNNINNTSLRSANTSVIKTSQRLRSANTSDFFFPLFFEFKKGCNPFAYDCATTHPSPVISIFSSTFLSSFLQVKERLYSPSILSFVPTLAWHRIKCQCGKIFSKSPIFGLAHLCSGMLLAISSTIVPSFQCLFSRFLFLQEEKASFKTKKGECHGNPIPTTYNHHYFSVLLTLL